MVFFSERHRQKAVTDGEHLMEGQGRWKNTKHYSALGQRSIFESVECLPRSVTFNLPSDQTNGYGDYGERLHRWVQQISSNIAIHIYPLHRPNSLEMGDRGGWGPGAPPGGWGGPPRTQVQQVPHKSYLFSMRFSSLHRRCGLRTRSRKVELVMGVLEEG